jgi:glycosyltransferase involved in cell wall biosynthesis
MQPLAQVLPAARTGGHLVEVVVPVHNEEHVLEASIRRLHAYLTASFPFAFRITIADNASTDGTWPLARRLAQRFPSVRAVRLAEKGRGRALRPVHGRQRRRLRDRRLGRRDLHRDQRRRDHRLRPDRLTYHHP